MVSKRKEFKCPWCDAVLMKPEVKPKLNRNDYGTVLERRCSKCGKVLAAYLDGEGDFLPKVRTF